MDVENVCVFFIC